MFIFFSQSANLFKKWISTSSSTREVLGVPIRHTQMEKSNGIKCRKHFWFVVSVSVILSISLFYFNSSALIRSKKETQLSKDGYRLGIATEPNFLLDTDIDSANDQFHVFNQSSVIENKMEPMVKKNKGEKELRSDQLTQDKVEEEADAEEEEKKVSITNEVEVTGNNESLILKNQLSESDARLKEQEGTSSFEIPDDPCKGKYIYVHDLPSKFNSDLVQNCRTLSLWTDMCYYLSNMGLGPPLGNSQGVFTNKGWYATNQFTLDLIFHNRMKQYKCLTMNSSMASAIYVPFYAGFEVSRYLWGFNLTTRDATASELVKWLSSRPEWKVWGGRDHFLVAGRITWDFRRVRDKESDWGNKLFVLPEGKNMSMLTIESSPWHSNDIAIPYPTYFHPSSDEQVIQWQNRMRKQKKRYLFSFAGAPRPSLPESIRNHIIHQCRASKKKCKLLECNRGDRCHNPSNVMKLFQNSIFCLQPSGDSYTRRSAFDSILAGCIPVFFHPGSAYVQYIWYFPRDHRKYSVLIPEEDVRNGKVNIETRLRSIPAKKVKAMREEVIKMIPRLVYADPRSRLGTLEDAFDVAVKGVLQRVEKVKRKVREGKVSDDPVVEFNNWKYELFGTAGEHEWDHFF